MIPFKQFAFEQSYQIYFMLKMGFNQTDIAKEIGVHRSTIGRELQRYQAQREYRPMQAHRFFVSRRNKAKTFITPETRDRIEQLIR